MATQACPICSQQFPTSKLEQHVNECLDNPAPPPDHNNSHDEDFLLAMKLQQEEEDRNVRATTIKCQLCSQPTEVDALYILDECGHKFCRHCIATYVEDAVMTTVNMTCPIKDCKKPLSVRDMKELLPQKKPKHTNPGLIPQHSTQKATQRLIAELKHIMETEPEKQGYSVEPVDDNMYHWELRFFNFDKKEPIAQDLKNLKADHILLHITFPPTYPLNPPFVRVIRPRFAFRTGHVTIGGSICTELLTNKGWTPANTIEAVIVSIRAGFLEGGARLDLHNKHDYSIAEAKDAFDRMVQTHGWY